MAPDWRENDMPKAGQEPVIGSYNPGYNDRAIRSAIKEQEAKVNRKRGLERFKALCRILGLHPSTIKDL